MMATPRGAQLAAGLTVVVLALGATACSGGGGGGGSSSDTSAAAAPSETSALAPGVAGSKAQQHGVADGALGDVAPQQAAVISTGAVQLRSGDVGKTLFEVRDVVDLDHGTLAQESTQTDKHGQPAYSRMVVRVPSASFESAMTALGKLATLVATSSNSKDVTTAVLDNDVRVQVAKRSITRISALLDQAASIKDVISIESELSQRQADLASLEQQQRYLADQTSMSTIVVSVEHAPATTTQTPDHHDHSGFLAGLGAGWKGLTAAGVAAATLAGVLLPWLVVAGLVAIPGWPLLRRLGRLRRRRMTRTA